MLFLVKLNTSWVKGIESSFMGIMCRSSGVKYVNRRANHALNIIENDFEGGKWKKRRVSFQSGVILTTYYDCSARGKL